jgi:hypothetical protein
MSLCKFQDIFGKPNEGLHKYRVFGMAAVDLGMTILLALLLCRWKKKWNFLVVLAILLLISVVVHKLFCVKTKLSGLV